MNKKAVLYFLIAACASGCGVKGDPMPPGKAPELGRGKPNHKRATESLAFPVIPSVGEDNTDEENEKSESGQDSEY